METIFEQFADRSPTSNSDVADVSIQSPTDRPTLLDKFQW